MEISMTDKFKAILIKASVELKKLGWKIGEDPEISLLHDKLLLHKAISVTAYGDEQKKYNATIDTLIELTLETPDENVYFPAYTVNAELSMSGDKSKLLSYKSDVDIALTDNDLHTTSKARVIAVRLDQYVKEYIQSEYNTYIEHNGNSTRTHYDDNDDR